LFIYLFTASADLFFPFVLSRGRQTKKQNTKKKHFFVCVFCFSFQLFKERKKERKTKGSEKIKLSFIVFFFVFLHFVFVFWGFFVILEERRRW
jgi:uncharacterized membrane protein